MARKDPEDAARRPVDETFVRNQPALRKDAPRSWLLWAGLLGAVSVAFLIANLGAQFAAALTGILALVALYAAMLVCAATMRTSRRRNVVLAALMIAMVLVSVAALIAVAALRLA